MIFSVYNSNELLTAERKTNIIDFLHQHMDEYGDAKTDIEKAIDHSLRQSSTDGGFTMVLKVDGTTVGAAVVNDTGMSGYIPENILVYIAIDGAYRGKGMGRALMQKVIDHSYGDIALHVEADNPAKILYEKLGFTNPYLEMRLKK